MAQWWPFYRRRACGKGRRSLCKNGVHRRRQYCPTLVVISGVHKDIGEICEQFKREKVGIQPLNVSHAFHSPLMDPMLSDFEKIASEITYASPRRIHLECYGDFITGEVANPAYWVRHVREPVRFSASMNALSEKGYGVFVEIGPETGAVGDGKTVSQKT